MRKISWTAEVHKCSGVIEVDDDTPDDEVWEQVDDEARQYFSTDWKEDAPRPIEGAQ